MISKKDKDNTKLRPKKSLPKDKLKKLKKSTSSVKSSISQVNFPPFELETLIICHSEDEETEVPSLEATVQKEEKAQVPLALQSIYDMQTDHLMDGRDLAEHIG